MRASGTRIIVSGKEDHRHVFLTRFRATTAVCPYHKAHQDLVGIDGEKETGLWIFDIVLAYLRVGADPRHRSLRVKIMIVHVRSQTMGQLRSPSAKPYRIQEC